MSKLDGEFRQLCRAIPFLQWACPPNQLPRPASFESTLRCTVMRLVSSEATDSADSDIAVVVGWRNPRGTRISGKVTYPVKSLLTHAHTHTPHECIHPPLNESIIKE
ncbi:unnamed protein product [Taenia asiatica]|uniref:Uncharacterized protein n=1 Tax=Taenia asiatica TaxID=60517 RepID=A0A0R3WCS3_TAEAS|nr:unnamed protein product [Taenia asiatica]